MDPGRRDWPVTIDSGERPDPGAPDGGAAASPTAAHVVTEDHPSIPAATVRVDPQAAGLPDRYKWVAMAVIFVGTFMVILDTTIVNVALPQIGIALDDAAGIEWVVTAYLLAVGVGLPATGWLADRYGRKQIFVASLTIFTLASLGAALSPNLSVLVAVRVVQGLGGGAMMPVGMAMIYELFPPHRRGTALGIWGVAAMAGPAFGPVIGGYLVTEVSWHWLFLVNVPIGAAAITLAVWLLRDTGYREARPFDAPGLALAATALAGWLYAFSNASDWGWMSPPTLALLGGGTVLLALFVRRELRIPHPLIQLRIFTVRLFTLTIVIGWAVVILQYARMVFLPLELETLRGMTALEVGVLFIPSAAAAAVTFFFGGRLTDRIGPRIPVMCGAALLTTAALILGTLDPDTALGIVLVGMIVQGFGSGFALMPVAVTGMNSLPGRYVAQASAVRNLNSRVAASFGIAVLASIVATQMGSVSAEAATSPVQQATAQSAYNSVFLIGAAGTVVAFVLAFFLPNAEQNRALHAARADEHDTADFDVDV